VHVRTRRCEIGRKEVAKEGHLYVIAATVLSHYDCRARCCRLRLVRSAGCAMSVMHVRGAIGRRRFRTV